MSLLQAEIVLKQLSVGAYALQTWFGISTLYLR
jgi:hypothetical protein